MKLEFKNVTKQYGEVNAVNKVNCNSGMGGYADIDFCIFYFLCSEVIAI